ncbi:MAG: lycopene cyclase, partial [Leeuwenhoekiella sp.]
WYDLLFLDVLYRKNEDGNRIFEAMFKNNPTDKIFRFLDGESTLAEDLKIIWSLPKKEFMKAFFKTLF